MEQTPQKRSLSSSKNVSELGKAELPNEEHSRNSPRGPGFDSRYFQNFSEIFPSILKLPRFFNSAIKSKSKLIVDQVPPVLVSGKLVAS